MALALADLEAPLHEAQSSDASEAPLTCAEREVRALVLAGRSNAEIARARGTSLRTVANQIASMFRKLGVGSRIHLVASVCRDGRDSDARRTDREEPQAPLIPWRTLTPEERAVLSCAAGGAAHKAIAYELGISAGLVSRRLASVTRKTGVRSRLHLVVAYWRSVNANP